MEKDDLVRIFSTESRSDSLAVFAGNDGHPTAHMIVVDGQDSTFADLTYLTFKLGNNNSFTLSSRTSDYKLYSQNSALLAFAEKIAGEEEPPGEKEAVPKAATQFQLKIVVGGNQAV